MEEILGIIMMACVIGGFMFAVGDNEYKSFMRDCKYNEDNKQMFVTNETYLDMWGESKFKVDEVKLQNYCQNKYSSIQKYQETNN